MLMQTLAASPPVYPAACLIHRLTSLTDLPQAEVALLRSLGRTRERWAAGAEVQAQGALIRKSRVVLSGWAGRQRFLSGGQRQIFEFLLPGDVIGLNPRPQSLAMASTVALSPLETADAGPLRDAIKGQQALRTGLARAVELGAAEEEARLLDHIVRLGRLSAPERVAHLLLELHDRLRRVGLAMNWRFQLPLTQVILADTLGLSLVHLNRTLGELRRESLIELSGGWVRIVQPEPLQVVAHYYPLTIDELVGRS